MGPSVKEIDGPFASIILHKVAVNKNVMILYNALHVSSLDCSLINPFMIHLTGIVVDECPKFLADIPSIAHHSLYFLD